MRSFSTIQTVAFICLAPLIPAGISAIWHPKHPIFSQKQPIPELDFHAALQLKDILWIDARPRAAFEKAHIPSAILLNFEEWDTLFDGFLEKWKPSDRIIVYCGKASCETSKELAERLKRELQIENIFVLKGGWEAWHRTQ